MDIHWSMLSAFRDDYRQTLAAGFKARTGNSKHGGSRATGGYGHGQAIDITTADGDAGAVWHWIDAHGAKYGLHRPIPGPDPAHIQPRNKWQRSRSPCAMPVPGSPIGRASKARPRLPGLRSNPSSSLTLRLRCMPAKAGSSRPNYRWDSCCARIEVPWLLIGVGRADWFRLPPPSEPDVRISRIRLSSRWSYLMRTDGPRHGHAAS